MTESQKAKELVDDYDNLLINYIEDEFDRKLAAKQCARIAVNEILQSNPTLITCNISILNYAYWIEVKTQINKL